jgi:hypothetical protein
VAAYLKGDADAAAPSDKILERLTAPAAPKPAPAPVETATPKIDEAKLAGLAKLAEAPAPIPKAAPAPPPAPVQDLSKANEKLSSLLGQTDGPKK